MRIAVITDVHSNFRGLCAVLDDIDAQRPDMVVGAGDMIGCSVYSRTSDVWAALHACGIPFVLGNEEARILDFFSPDGDPYLKDSVQFLPLRHRTRQLSPQHVETLRTLPHDLLIAGPGRDDVYVCHASPGNLWKSPIQGIDAEMAMALGGVRANVVALGHYHSQWRLEWRGKLLVMAGSAGLPLRNTVGEVDYLLLTHRNGTWEAGHRSVRYDHEAALAEVLEGDFLEQCGPIGWLMLVEAITQTDRLNRFFRDYCPQHCGEQAANDWDDWQTLVAGYLQETGQWALVERHVRPFMR